MSLQERDDEDKTIYRVVVNDEEQYSIWPDYREIPPGWRDAGRVGPKAECLAYIKDAWTDMRPLSLRKKMAETASTPPAQATSGLSQSPKVVSLIERLCDGDHPVALSLRPEPTIKRFKEAIDEGYLHVKFTGTSPGTELGVRLNKGECNFDGADFEAGAGTIRAVGDLSLDYVRVRCVVNIDLETLAGRGHLERVEAEGSRA